ncbi:MAG: HicB family protein [Candidatus Vogelbacteria bacterium CG10_big_fil_rev_8_21_14_0_10_51_16]|uniref:HicB family protein n=1 Tax=Candidatus Vogelbacteria bacterium CG10_big_fil_rev_8_21_14_0_10_51_16 TaxID=1975045 RepID=A0A2H0RDK2_9BACT|nr:MAG: HicB family protein [Candidatus Vogelbacteria bacterium CG10_big_fil_rev_8_21_14_0_10_51_16]
MLKYTVMYEPAEEGGYVVRIPTLGAATQGETLEEAQAMAKECIEANIIGLQELTKKVFT